ncbi:hypothetical protein K491DRAFT_387581 [Lophiostoma macrostomum CBS 122681]|uniref:WW domain-containing protein n=1 Tax=Lophiostoma macrostomum CBS 122681 TaxID=1314788 RepID=A0A6A6TRP0_9PLEO|nr:hypothetical protein K491DRAFT_387581 [Lophiostoma macrostomum CBS 122681]
MSTLHPPSDAPPSYEAATGSGTTPNRLSMEERSARTERSGIPADRRRSMEDEQRELPPGWIRQFDSQEGHQFFVDTTKEPPRSIWVHPYDDPTFLSTLSPEERKKHSRLHRSSTLEDLAAEDTDNEDHHEAKLPPREGAAGQPKGIHKFGRKMKDKVTGTTHEQREQQRRQREEQERRIYQAHLRARQAMIRAMETSQPQLLGKDREGKDVYILPPGGDPMVMGTVEGTVGAWACRSLQASWVVQCLAD